MARDKCSLTGERWLKSSRAFLHGIARYETRSVTKLATGGEITIHEEYNKQFYYHSEQLVSVALITDHRGDEYQRIEYTPYDEV